MGNFSISRQRRAWLVSVAAAIMACACTPKPGGDTQDSSGSQTGPGSSSEPTTDPVMSATGSTAGSTGGTAEVTDTGEPTGPGSSTQSASTGGTTETGDASDSLATSTGDTMASCPGGMKLMQSQAKGFYGGIEMCPETGPHRDEAVTCKVLPAISACERGECAGGCDEFATGACNEASPGDCSCIYPCSLDADCGAGAACLCGTSDDFIFGTGCRPASCLTDADCGELECGVSPSVCRTGEALHCRTPEDDCRIDADCLPGNDRCAFEVKLGRWSCSSYAFCS